MKIFAGVLYKRLANWERRNRILSESQAGFRSGYSTVDNIFNLVNIIKLSHSQNIKKVYAFFVDFRSAFDTYADHYFTNSTITVYLTR